MITTTITTTTTTTARTATNADVYMRLKMLAADYMLFWLLSQSTTRIPHGGTLWVASKSHCKTVAAK